MSESDNFDRSLTALSQEEQRELLLELLREQSKQSRKLPQAILQALLSGGPPSGPRAYVIAKIPRQLWQELDAFHDGVTAAAKALRKGAAPPVLPGHATPAKPATAASPTQRRKFPVANAIVIVLCAACIILFLLPAVGAYRTSSEVQRRLIAVDSEAKRLESEVAGKQTKLQTTRREIARLTEIEEKLKPLQSSLTKLDQRVSQQQGDLARIETEISRLSRPQANLRDEGIKKLETNLINIQSKLDETTREIAKLSLPSSVVPPEAEPKTEEPVAQTDREITNSIGMELVLISAGEFMMGSPKNEESRSSDEGPQHRVKITKPFYIGKYEVTQEQYEAIMGKNPSWFKGPNNPVEGVSYNDAVEFCRKLSEKEGKQYSLPTETEWEYACRAGTTTPFAFGETISTDQANYDGGYTYGSGRKGVYREKTLPVGSLKANAWGLYDMHGNVYEWCADWYDENYYKNSPVEDPKGPARGSFRVLRGGSWRDNPMRIRSANRNDLKPTYRNYDNGFRVVLRARGFR